MVDGRNERDTHENPALRWLDSLVALIAILLLGPVLLALATLVRLDSRGPIIYSEERPGRFGKPFRIYKFRTLHPRLEDTSPVAASDDSRITGLGGWLRRSHLDELPQLFNILRGEMRFVGPRPTREELWAGIDEKLRRRALAFVPGLTSPASIHFECEDDVLAEVDNPEQAYRDVLLPAKMTMDVRHFERCGRLSDLKVLLATPMAILDRRGKEKCRRRVRQLLSRSDC